MAEDVAAVAGAPSTGPWRRCLAAWSQRVILALLRCYRRWLSPLLPPRCRFYPSCSHYAMLAIQRHGTVRGGVLALKRLLRCHPLHPGGVDPVPGDP